MAGYREYCPGQIWFYYNPNQSKEAERRKELGAVTSRPVVIVQSAFYPEWNDTVTVCPMTSSDRRTGIHIESTILKDGSLVEGGTVMPYLFYTVKTKFLYPMISNNHKRKLLSLDPSDFELVMKGVAYHLGFSTEIPDYVANWKTLDDYDRRIVMHDIYLAIDDTEDMMEGDKPDLTNRAHINPKLIQTPPPDDSTIENHMLASLTKYDREKQMLYEESSPFTEEPIASNGPKEDPTPVEKSTDAAPKESVSEPRTKRAQSTINFQSMCTKSFLTTMENLTGLVLPQDDCSDIQSGSKILEGIELKAMPDKLSLADQYKIAGLPISQIVDCTGIKSNSTASRLRMLIREKDWSFLEDESIPDSFKYTSEEVASKIRSKRNLKRFKMLFGVSKDTIILLAANKFNADEMMQYFQCPRSYVAKLQEDAQEWYNAIRQFNKDVKGTETKASAVVLKNAPVESASEPDYYDFWETLCPSEIHEIMSTDKKNMAAMCKRFGIKRNMANTVKRQCCEIRLDQEGNNGQPSIYDQEYYAAVHKVFNASNYAKLSHHVLMVFCRMEPSTILKYYGMLGYTDVPRKADIKELKRKMRFIIVRYQNPT